MGVFLRVLLLVGLATASGLSFDEKAAKARPVTKVINLLKDMQKQLEAEGDEDAEVYDKMVCWCETNDKEKTKAIADAEQHIEDLTNSIEDLTANSATLTQEITTLKKEVEKSTEALEKATAMLSKELAEFNAEEKEALQSIASLKSAVTVLGKHQSFLQSGSRKNGELRQVTSSLKALKTKKVLMEPTERKALMAFIQQPEDFVPGLLQQAQPASAGSYAPQSGQIFGILKNMKESFEANAENARKEEADAVAQFTEMKAAKEDEIAAGTEQIQTKTQELADSDEKCASDKQTKEDTENTLAADRKFLSNLKETCASLDAQMEERAKARALEIEACSKALAVLSSDEAHDLFTSTFNFAQEKASNSIAHTGRREKASRVLREAAERTHNPRLSMLATEVRLNAFKKVKESIQKMVNSLVKEKEDEIKFKDYCIEEFNTNTAETQVKDREKEDLIAKVDELKNTVATLDKQLKELHASVAEMRKQMKEAGEDRELENKAFMETVADQRATQKLLQSALKILEGVYASAAMLQEKKQGKQQPPAEFKSYKQNENSGGVMGMIKTIIADAKRAEADAVRAEGDSQKAYENFVKDTNQAVDASTVEITNTGEAKAKNEGELSEAQQDLDAVMATLQALSEKNAGLHGECDFILKNFDVRQASRDDEMEALKDSIGILSGASGF